MKKKVLFITIILVLICALTGCSSIAALIQNGVHGSGPHHIDVSDLQTSNMAAVVANNTVESCVRIRVEFMGTNQAALGSGFVITTDGYIVTNRHVVEDSAKIIKKIVVAFEDDTAFEAHLIRKHSQENKDIAVIKIDDASRGDKQFIPIKLDDTSQVYYGHETYTFGNPEGLGLIFSKLMVAAVDHKVKVNDSLIYDNVILLDGNVNHGNSGGVLLNILGNAIGLIYGRIESASSSVNNVYGLGCALGISDVIDFLDTIPECKTKYIKYVPESEVEPETEAAAA